VRLPGRLRAILRTHPRLAAATLIGLLVGGTVVGLRWLGALESLEIAVYDRFVRLTAAPRQDSRVAMVAVTEPDIQALATWPTPDGVLARVIDTVRSADPRAIGLDIYRDVPVAPGSEDLARALRADARVVVVTKFGDRTSPTVAPPAALKGTDQVGFNDIVVDPGGTVRRGLIFLDDGATAMSSFALQLVLRYLEREGIGLAPDPADETKVRLGRTTITPLEPDDGGYVGADARGYQFLLDYAHGPRAFPVVTLGAVLDGTFDRAALRDRVVLIGIMAESVKDHFYTPFSRGLGEDQHMPGVEVHAQIAAQLLRMALDGIRPVTTLPEWQEWLWIVAWSVGGGLVTLWARSPWKFALAAPLGLVVITAIAWAAFVERLWIPLLPAALGWGAAEAVVTAYTSYREAADRGELMKLFSKHVSREVAEAIWLEREHFLDGNRPRPQRLVVTGFFNDLTGFTTVSEKLGPEGLMEWLNELMDAMAQELTRYGGVIRQYAGDSIVAVFGIPVARRTEAEIHEDARRAVECALAMERRLLELNDAWRAAGRPVTGMRIGIYTGPVVAGSLGSAERSEYVVVGDTMNTASRLESYDKDFLPPDPLTSPCRILVGDTTVACLGGRFDTEWVGDLSLKGKEQTVGVYRVITHRAGAAPEILQGRQQA
jgi:adenylate cyclase